METSGTILRLNAVRVIIMLMIAMGYASTMPLGPSYYEIFRQLNIEPSWIGVQLLFFFSGALSLRSLRRHGSITRYITSRMARNLPLLVLFTLVAILVIYPIYGSSPFSPHETTSLLKTYFFETVFCINPGQKLPGLLDHAKYQCLIQGAIWTFKWGFFAYLITILALKMGFLKHNRTILALFCLVTALYFGLNYIQAKSDTNSLYELVLTLRLSYAYLGGMVIFAYRDRLPKSHTTQMLIIACLAVGAIYCQKRLPWTPAIELLLVSAWAYGAYLLATSQTKYLSWLNNWPNIALGIYLVNWPVSQILLLQFPELTAWQLILTSLPITIWIAYFTHKLLTRYLYRFADYISSPKPLVQSTTFEPLIKGS